jgi:hypothetical protein
LLKAETWENGFHQSEKHEFSIPSSEKMEKEWVSKSNAYGFLLGIGFHAIRKGTRIHALRCSLQHDHKQRISM